MTKQEDIGLLEMVKDLWYILGLTQEQLAAKIGVTWTTVNQWNKGRGKPSLLALRAIRELDQANNESSTAVTPVLANKTEQS